MDAPTSGSSPSPINNYDVAVYVGRYAHFTDTYDGEGGHLTLDFWPLAYHLEARARPVATRSKPMLAVLRALVRTVSLVPRRLPADRGAAPRHGAPERRRLRQRLPATATRAGISRAPAGASRGTSSSSTRARTSGGATASPRTTSPTCGCTRASPTTRKRSTPSASTARPAGATYVIGHARKLIKNDAPIVGPYGVNAEGSGDMYYKGGNMLHTHPPGRRQRQHLARDPARAATRRSATRP